MIVKINNIISSSSTERKVITEENNKQKNNNTVDIFDDVIRLKGIGRTNWDEPY